MGLFKLLPFIGIKKKKSAKITVAHMANNSPLKRRNTVRNGDIEPLNYLTEIFGQILRQDKVRNFLDRRSEDIFSIPFPLQTFEITPLQ
jgi:hypothetical protein